MQRPRATRRRAGRHDWFYYTSTKCAIPDDIGEHIARAVATLTPDIKSDEGSEPSYDLKAAALRACTQHRGGGEGQGGECESDDSA
jgi:hypothetical protein